MLDLFNVVDFNKFIYPDLKNRKLKFKNNLKNLFRKTFKKYTDTAIWID